MTDLVSAQFGTLLQQCKIASAPAAKREIIAYNHMTNAKSAHE